MEQNRGSFGVVPPIACELTANNYFDIFKEDSSGLHVHEGLFDKGEQVSWVFISATLTGC